MNQGYLNSVELRGSKIGDEVREHKIDFEALHEGMKMKSRLYIRSTCLVVPFESDRCEISPDLG